jgi:hypothetical protein
MDEHDGAGDPRFTALYRGVVTDNADPLKVGRVKVRVPGLLEPSSGWALPLNVGGGAEALGLFFVPEVGAEVAVWFHQGDVDEVHYIPGCFRAPRRTSGLNARVSAKSPADAPKVKVLETDRWLVVLDDSLDTPGLLLSDKVSGDGIELDGLTRQMSIVATSSIRIAAIGTVAIEGVNVTINGRPVAPSTEPI